MVKSVESRKSKVGRVLCLVLVLCCGIVAVAQDTVQTKKYTASDFLDAVELPTMIGVSITPAGYESVALNTAFRLGWRQGRTYGGFAYIEYDMHMPEYKQLQAGGYTINNGDVIYNDVFLAGGYRLPLVKDLRAYYAQPYNNAVSMYMATGPGMSILQIKTPTMVDNDNKVINMGMLDNPVVPAWKVALGVDWLIIPQLALFLESSYTQHLKPTIIEQQAMDRGEIKGPSG